MRGSALVAALLGSNWPSSAGVNVNSRPSLTAGVPLCTKSDFRTMTPTNGSVSTRTPVTIVRRASPLKYQHLTRTWLTTRSTTHHWRSFPAASPPLSYDGTCWKRRPMPWSAPPPAYAGLPRLLRVLVRTWIITISCSSSIPSRWSLTYRKPEYARCSAGQSASAATTISDPTSVVMIMSGRIFSDVGPIHPLSDAHCSSHRWC